MAALQILHHAALIFDGGQGRGGAGNEQGQQTRGHPGVLDFLGHRRGQVQYIGAGRGLYFETERFKRNIIKIEYYQISKITTTYNPSSQFSLIFLNPAGRSPGVVSSHPVIKA